ncbi:MAG: hypothetical protein OIF32_10230, partial [Campylobacterales bacterium]|nr:hypothetical protein [Campylobacterales bacterium]
IHFFSPKNYKYLFTQELNKQVIYKYTKANASSKDGKLLCLYDNELKKTFIYMFSTSERKFVKKVHLKWNEGVTEISRFSRDDKFIGVGSANGTTCIYSGKNGKLIATLPKQSEYISEIAFSKKNSLVAFSSFNKRLIIYDLLKNKPITNYTNDDVISSMAFLNKLDLVVCCNRDNRIFLFDVTNGKTVRELGETIASPVAIKLDENDQYCL